MTGTDSPPRYRALVEATLSGDRPPIVPVFAHRHHPHADQDGGLLADATLAWWRRFDFDLIKLTPASTWQMRDRGLEDADDPDDPLGRRRVTLRPIIEPDDWRRLRRLDPTRGFSAEILRAATAIKRAAPHVPVLVTVYAPASQAAKLAGTAPLAAHLRDAPGAVAEGMKILRDDTVRTIHALADIGVDGVFLAVQTARAALFSVEAYTGFALAADLACLEAARTLPVNILHLHGDDVHGALFRDRPPSLIHTESTEARAGAGGHGVVAGPSPWGDLSTGPPERVWEECRSWLTPRPSGPFILAPSCTVPTATPTANLDALRRAAHATDSPSSPPEARIG